MSKLIQYFYIFSKVTTSLVLLLVIIIMGYLLFRSYTEVDISNNQLDKKLLSLSEVINNNSSDLLNIKKKLTNNEIIIHSIEKSLDNKDNNLNEVEIKKNISDLFDFTQILEKKLNHLSLSLDKDNKSNNVSSVETDQRDEVNSLIDFIIKKYEAGDTINSELILLKKMLPINQNVFLEKLDILALKKFYGFNFFDKLFEDSSLAYVKNKFLETNQSEVIKFLSKFISIRPANLNNYENNDLNILLKANEKIKLRDIKKALSLIMLIDKKQIYFTKWIEQAKNYIDFISTIQKVKIID